MTVTRKDATITNLDDAFPGTFRVVLSAPTRDRDGDTLLPTEWKQPLPDHVTFDQDHLMSVAGTVGSGRPWIDHDGTAGGGKGALIVDGAYSSLPRAQEVRTLVREGHINRTSVAFLTEKTQKDGAATTVRELLNGAFVAVPSNREAVILDSKSHLSGVKAGRRNSAADQVRLDAIARHAIALGGNPTGGDTTGNEDVAVGRAFRPKRSKAAVDTTDTTDTTDDDVAELAAAVDAAIDAVIAELDTVDTATLPAALQQAIALVHAADTAVDELLDALGVQDPDEDAAPAATPDPAAAAKAAAAGPKNAATVDHSIEMQARAARLRVLGTITRS